MEYEAAGSAAVAILMAAPKTQIRKSIQADLDVQRDCENMRLRRRANQWFLFARPAPDQEGRFAIVTNVWCGMRWTRAEPATKAPDADGEVVWF